MKGGYKTQGVYIEEKTLFQLPLYRRLPRSPLLSLNLISKILAGWVLYNAYTLKWSVSKFNFKQAEILTETIELTYSYFENNPNG